MEMNYKLTLYNLTIEAYAYPNLHNLSNLATLAKMGCQNAVVDHSYPGSIRVSLAKIGSRKMSLAKTGRQNWQ